MRVGIIGSGISGLTAAFLLHKHHNIHVFEKEKWIGGHTHTLEIPEQDKILSIDTGFIVFNNKTYPLFNKLINQLGVNKKESNMSFSVYNKLNGLEYNGTNLNKLFAQRKNIFNLKYLRMLFYINTLNNLAKKSIEKNKNLSLTSFIENHQINQYTIDNYLLPMCCSIWSCKKEQILDTPASFIFDFLNNHGLLNINDRPQWFVISNGSKEYVNALKKSGNISFHLQEPAVTVIHDKNQVILNTRKNKYFFDKLIFATHADDTLKLLKKPTYEETETLSCFPYQNNKVTLHTDIAVLPKNKRAWACWNYLIDTKSLHQCRLSYNMNLLQSLESQKTYCVSVNQNDLICEQKIIAQFNYQHPIYTKNSFNAQKKHLEISGKNNIFFCGAYWGYGFHEDGVRSAIHISEQLGGDKL